MGSQNCYMKRNLQNNTLTPILFVLLQDTNSMEIPELTLYHTLYRNYCLYRSNKNCGIAQIR